MQNLQNNPIHRNAERRRNESRAKREQEQRKRAQTKEIIAAIKILLLWIFCFVAVTVFIVAMETLLPHRFVLKWILIISFTTTLVSTIYGMTEVIKKSLRNGNSIKGRIEK